LSIILFWVFKRFFSMLYCNISHLNYWYDLRLSIPIDFYITIDRQWIFKKN